MPGHERELEEHEEIAPTSDGAKLTLHRIAAHGSRSSFPPVILTHGTFSNGKLCRSLGRHLAEQGFESWIVDWRGHGASPAGPAPLDYERLALAEVDAALGHVLDSSGREQVFWIGHSAGGVLPFIYLAHHPAQATRFRGVVALGSQTTHAGRGLAGKLALGLGYGLTNLLGRAPGRLFRLGPDDESAPLMNQWFRWNLSGRWIGRDGFDYLAELAAVDVPLLCFAGGADRFIAPVDGCRRLFDAVGSRDKEFVHCTRGAGFAVDYTHAGLIAGKQPAAALWPRIRGWLASQAERPSAELPS